MEHCHFYCWTIENGSRLYFIERDREYWNYVYCALEEFWHKNLVPAREVLLASNGLDVEAAEVREEKKPNQKKKRKEKCNAIFFHKIDQGIPTTHVFMSLILPTNRPADPGRFTCLPSTPRF